MYPSVLRHLQNPGALQCKPVFNRYLGDGCSNQKNSKNKVHLFLNFVSGRTLLTHENVYEGLNALKCKGRSNKKIQKTKSIIFEFCSWEDPPHPQKCI